MPEGFRFLGQGIDSLYCAYFLRPQGRSGELYHRLGVEKERLQTGKPGGLLALGIAGREFLLHPRGTSTGYPFLLTCPEFVVSTGENNNPSFYVEYPSAALWQHGAAELQDRFLRWAADAGFQPVQGEAVSRVDFACDYQLDSLDFVEEHFVSRAKKEATYRDRGVRQTFQFGLGDVVLRVYDKAAEIEESSQKTWFYDLWGVREGVWRIEWQVRREVLQGLDIRSLTDLLDLGGDLCLDLAQNHTTLRRPNDDSNRSRWPLHPLWQDLQRRLEGFGRQGLLAVRDDPASVDERLLRIAQALYGYVKQVAALNCVRDDLSGLSVDEALYRTSAMVRRLHEEITWRTDVRERIDRIRLEPW